MAYRGSSFSAAVFAVAFVNVAVAEPERCREAVSKASADFVQARLKTLAKCEDRVLSGALPFATDCATDASTADALATAGAKMRSRIESACGGSDRSCGTVDDEPLAGIGWSAPTCPDLMGGGCDGAIGHCGQVADCLTCVGGSATDELRELYFDALADSPPADVEKCQRVIGKAATRLARTRSKALQKCWNAVSKGKATGPCPDPGDAKAATKIARAQEKMITSICKACGGDDRGCDAAVGAVPGTGGSDDLSVAAIGFAPSCPDVTVPGAGSSCAAPIATLSDVVSCVACVSNFEVDCADRLAVPWAVAYPSECGSAMPGATQTPTQTSTQTATATSTHTHTATATPSTPSGGTSTPTPTPTDTGTPDMCETVVYTEDFTGTDGSPWPAPWVELENSIDPNPDIQGNRARFKPGPLPTFIPGRVYAPMSERDAEALFTVEFEDINTQGFGFYLRQNGGHVRISSTHGAGYAVFVEGFLGYHGIGLWRENDGIEERLPAPGNLDTSLSLSNGVRYRVRFRVSQMNASTTALRARIWPEGSPEPSTWNVEATDNLFSLQNVSAGIAVDSYSHLQPNPVTAYVFVDDIVVTRLCNPLYGIGAVNTVSEAFTFTEGPLWRDDALLFTDISTSTIHELAPPSTVGVFRSPSDQANGLATDVNGDLLAAEHQTRRLSRTDSMGAVSTLVDTYMGMQFNSPNDLVVRSDGTIYFTDPEYGLANPMDRELPFNGLFRRTAAGVLTAEWMGGTSSGPNGVSLSPDESVLYMTETASGTVLAWDVAVDGSLSNQRSFASGLTIPDGTCVDTRGNLYVATWANDVTVFSPLGDRWGTIGVPRAATNCAFGGADGLTMYVTAHEGLYSVPMVVPGIP